MLYVAARPTAMPGPEAGAQRLGGWISPDGRFYACPESGHIRLARRLRETGGGPADPWLMRDGWVMVKAHGEVVSLPSMTQPQWDTLGDMLVAAPPTGWRSQLLDSLRELRELEASTR
jgi:hypothetical protein